MADSKYLLIEIGTEELPPQALTRLASALRDGVRGGLDDQDLLDEGADAKWFCSPRRLALLISGVRGQQPEREEQDQEEGPPRRARGIGRLGEPPGHRADLLASGATGRPTSR